MATNPVYLENMAGMDTALNNTRVRATLNSPQGTNWMDGTGAAYSNTVTTSFTLTAAIVGGGYVTLAPTNATTVTLDTAANFWAYVNNNSSGAQATSPYTLNGSVSTTTFVGDSMAFLLVNGSTTNSITLAAGTNGAFDSNQSNTALAAGQSRYVFIQLALVSGVQKYFIYF